MKGIWKQIVKITCMKITQTRKQTNPSSPWDPAIRLLSQHCLCFVEGESWDRLCVTRHGRVPSKAGSPNWQREVADNQFLWIHFPVIVSVIKDSHQQVWERLVHHVIVVIAQTQFHCCESGPVLHIVRPAQVHEIVHLSWTSCRAPHPLSFF